LYSVSLPNPLFSLLQKRMENNTPGKTAFKLIHGAQQWYILSEPKQFQQEIPD